MELKDVILSTLAEMDSGGVTKSQKASQKENTEAPSQTTFIESSLEVYSATKNDEQLWLESVRERLLVLFEGFQSPNNVQIEAKVDLTLNFLEYLLANIDTRVERIKGKKE